MFYRGCRKENGGVCGSSPEADLQGGHYPALLARFRPSSGEMTELDDRVFCFYEMPKAPVTRGKVKAEMKMPGS
jgi:hypothetical protein